MKKRYLVLADGSVFEGFAFGADKDAIGEVVFNTAVEGYIETLTDPSYYGQIVTQTFPMIGNYGIIPDDFEGTPRLFGYIVREFCRHPSNFRSQMDIDEFLKKNSIPGIFGIDTRELVNRIREYGVINGMICSSVPENVDFLKNYTVVDAVKNSSVKEVEYYPAEGEEKRTVVLVDYGAKKNIIRSLAKRGCRVVRVPFDFSAEEILSFLPDGIMLSNGPGDPKENGYAIEQIQKLFTKKPIFGICLGHQLMALADGGETFKLKYGHRGANQPCRISGSHKTFITSQNHGYAVKSGSTKHGVESFVNANDGTVEGLEYLDFSAFSVQFHPEACAGPKDTDSLFDKFISLIDSNRE